MHSITKHLILFLGLVQQKIYLN